MAFIPTVNGIELVARYEANGFFWGTNTFHFEQLSGPAVAADLVDVYNDFCIWWGAEMDIYTALAVDLANVTVRALDSMTSPTYTNSPGLSGTIVSDALPPNSTIAVSLRTALGGKSGRGRLYQAGLPESLVSGKFLSSTVAGNLQIAYENLLTAPSFSGRPWSVLSKYTAGAPRAAGLLTPITSITFTDFRMDSMKTRLKD